DRTIAHLDGRFVSITGHWRGRVKTEYASAHLVMVLQMFCGMLVFNRSTRRHIKSLYRQMQSGRSFPKLQRQETDLYMNPRRVR
ncbi:MAG: hypothetical protein ACK5JT_17080, partial [Hyphomicrobiaceae bacterium]